MCIKKNWQPKPIAPVCSRLFSFYTNFLENACMFLSRYRTRIRESKMVSKNNSIKTRNTPCYVSNHIQTKCHTGTLVRHLETERLSNWIKSPLCQIWYHQTNFTDTDFFPLSFKPAAILLSPIVVMWGVLFPGDTKRATTVTKNSTVEYHVKFSRAKKTRLNGW